MLNRHLASRYDATNAIKSFDIPDVNAEALVDKEPLDCEEYLEESLDEVDEEFGTKSHLFDDCRGLNSN